MGEPNLRCLAPTPEDERLPNLGQIQVSGLFTEWLAMALSDLTGFCFCDTLWAV